MIASFKYLFVINTHAGSSNVSWQDHISNYFTGKPVDVHYFMLGKDMDTEALTQEIATIQPDKVIAVGGDGTVMLVAKLITGTRIVLGILPAGSANGLAKEFNIPVDPEVALSILDNGTAGICDAIKMNGNDISLHMSDIGINAQLIKYFSEGNLRGKLGYAKVLFKTLWHFQKFSVVIEPGKKTIKTKVYMVIIANASKYGTGAMVNPDGKPDDGKFELVIVRRLSLIEILKTFFRPGSLNPKKMEVIQVSSVHIQTRQKIHFQIDGEYIGKINELKATILPGYVNVIRGPVK